jgi:FkbM family methyltransferase
MIRKVLRFLRAYALLINPLKMGVFTEIAEQTNFDHAFSISYSQGGEDLALLNIFSGRTEGSYIDIGAHHPSRFSVTRKLYDLGWNGVNIDANKDLIANFQTSRPRDINICAAVGNLNQYKLHIFTEPAISTTNLIWRDKFLSEKNKVLKTELVSGVSLREILDKHFSNRDLDLLTIDIEGTDFEALASGDFSNLSTERFPSWILLESTPPLNNVVETESIKYAISLGYEIYCILPMSTILKYNSAKL